MLNTTVPVTIPARMLNEYTYCPRLAYLEWVQGEWADSADTIDGEFVHRNADREDRRALPTPAESSEPISIHTRSLHLENQTLGLVAVVDILEVEGNIVTPVDYKRGATPKTPEGAWEPDRVQVCAQALLLEAAGYTCHSAVIYYAASRQRVTIEIDDALKQHTKNLLAEFRQVAESGTIPAPLIDSPKCPRCSLVTICLPDETNLLQLGIPEQTEEASSPLSTNQKPQLSQATPKNHVRALLAPNDDARPLYVTHAGAKVGKSADRLVIEF